MIGSTRPWRRPIRGHMLAVCEIRLEDLLLQLAAVRVEATEAGGDHPEE